MENPNVLKTHHHKLWPFSIAMLHNQTAVVDSCVDSALLVALRIMFLLMFLLTSTGSEEGCSRQGRCKGNAASNEGRNIEL